MKTSELVILGVVGYLVFKAFSKTATAATPYGPSSPGFVGPVPATVVPTASVPPTTSGSGQQTTCSGNIQNGHWTIPTDGPYAGEIIFVDDTGCIANGPIPCSGTPSVPYAGQDYAGVPLCTRFDGQVSAWDGSQWNVVTAGYLPF